MAIGGMGRTDVGKLGASGKKGTPGAPPSGTTGEPIGLLLALTKAS